MWVGSDSISGWIFPANDEISVNNYWELRKIIYSVCIILVVLSAQYANKFKKFLSLVFIGVLGEDISDRFQGITYFEYTDILIVELVVLSSIYVIYKEELKNIYLKVKECFRH